MKLRVPYWATEGFDIKLNGKSLASEYSPCSYFEIPRRRWSHKDVVEIIMPYVRHIEYAPDKVVFPLGSAVAENGASPTRPDSVSLRFAPYPGKWSPESALSAGNLGVPERLGVLMEGPLVMAAVGVKSWDEAVLSLDSGGHPLTEGLTFIPDYQADTSITHYFRIHQ